MAFCALSLLTSVILKFSSKYWSCINVGTNLAEENALVSTKIRGIFALGEGSYSTTFALRLIPNKTRISHKLHMPPTPHLRKFTALDNVAIVLEARNCKPSVTELASNSPDIAMTTTTMLAMSLGMAA